MLAEYFKKLRFDKNHHLGLGDIRLTRAMQDEIIEGTKMKKYKASIYDYFQLNFRYGYSIYIDTYELRSKHYKIKYNAKRAAERVAEKLGITLEWKT